MQSSTRIPRDRISVLIGKKGETRKAIEEASGACLKISSRDGEVLIDWTESDRYDPLVALKLPEVIRAIGRGMAPSRAIQLLDDEQFLQIFDIRDFVGKRGNQLKRMRARLIGRNGRFREQIEEHSGCEISIYGSTVVVIGEDEGLRIAAGAVERILTGSEHGTVLRFLEKERRSKRMSVRRLESIEERDMDSDFAELVPGLSSARRAQRKLRNAHIESEDVEEVVDVMELTEDESIAWGEE